MTFLTSRYSSEDEAAITKFLRVLKQFEGMTIEQARILLSVALREGESIAYHARSLGADQKILSQRIDDLSETTRGGRPGRGLLSTRRNLLNRRELEIKLSAVGAALVTRVLRLVGGEQMAVLAPLLQRNEDPLAESLQQFRRAHVRFKINESAVDM